MLSKTVFHYEEYFLVGHSSLNLKARDFEKEFSLIRKNKCDHNNGLNTWIDVKEIAHSGFWARNLGRVFYWLKVRLEIAAILIV